MAKKKKVKRKPEGKSIGKIKGKKVYIHPTAEKQLKKMGLSEKELIKRMEEAMKNRPLSKLKKGEVVVGTMDISGMSKHFRKVLECTRDAGALISTFIAVGKIDVLDAVTVCDMIKQMLLDTINEVINEGTVETKMKQMMERRNKENPDYIG